MSDDEKRIIRGAAPFSKMARAATKADAVNAAANASQAAYDLMAQEHDRVMTAFIDDEHNPLRKEFYDFREIAARRIREIERRSFSYLVLTALRWDWLRLQLGVRDFFQPKELFTGDLENMPVDAKVRLTEAMERQRAGVVGGINPEDVAIVTEPVAMPSDTGSIEKPGTNEHTTPGATCGCDWSKQEACRLCAPKAEG